jgi:acetyl/propionyl-CoA carboxylase alpha subunit
MSELKYKGALYKAVVDGNTFEIQSDSIDQLDVVENGALSFHVLNECKSFTFRLVHVDPEQKLYTFTCKGKTLTVQLFNRTEMQVESLGLRDNGSLHVQEVEAPMPGLVLSVSVSPGEEVTTGQPLMILEAMKMENVITSPREGMISTVEVKAGDTVEKLQVLITFQ